jgi:hypothetical protein
MDWAMSRLRRDAERGLDVAFEQRLEGCLDYLVAELEDGGDLSPQILHTTDQPSTGKTRLLFLGLFAAGNR